MRATRVHWIVRTVAYDTDTNQYIFNDVLIVSGNEQSAQERYDQWSNEDDDMPGCESEVAVILERETASIKNGSRRVGEVVLASYRTEVVKWRGDGAAVMDAYGVETELDGSFQ